MNVQADSNQHTQLQYDQIFAPTNLDHFEVTDAYTYFDYSHEELLAARFFEQQVAVGTLMVEEPGEDESQWLMREPAVILDPQKGCWLVAKMFDGFDAEVWDDAENLRDLLAQHSTGTIRLIALVLGSPRTGLVVPDRLSEAVFAEDELAQLLQMVVRTPVCGDASQTCQDMLEMGDFIDAKQSDMREIPRWLWLDILRDSTMAKQFKTVETHGQPNQSEADQSIE